MTDILSISLLHFLAKKVISRMKFFVDTLSREDTIMKSVIDRFGEDVDTKRSAIGYFVARVRVPASPTFFAWLFPLGTDAYHQTG